MIGLGAASGGCHRSVSFGGVDGGSAEAPELFEGASDDLLLPPNGLSESVAALQMRKPE